MEEISYPLKYEIKIDFCREKKKFYLSTPISNATSPSVKKYVEARKNHVFKPHATSLRIDQDAIVRLIQEVPFYWGRQPPFREQMAQFWRLVKQCHKMLSEIAIEEKVRSIQRRPQM